VPVPSQRRALGALFLVLGLGFAGIAYAAGVARQWVIAVAAAAIAIWFGSLSRQMLRRR
jgi:hypothetical protein